MRPPIPVLGQAARSWDAIKGAAVTFATVGTAEIKSEWIAQAEMLDVSIETNSYRVSDFLGWMRDGSLELRPHYQRGLVWKPAERSFLIDSVVRRYPLPLIVLQDETDSDGRLIRRVVDGQQRLRTLIAFVDRSVLSDRSEQDNFRYTPPELRRKRVSFSFEELSQDLRSRILRTVLPTVSIASDRNDNVVLELYDRLNSTGSALKPQELRLAQRSGTFSEMSYRLARENQTRWTDWKIFRATDIARMSEVEFSGELLLLAQNGVDKTGKKELDDAYETFDIDAKNQESLEYIFRETMDSIDNAFAYPEVRDPFKTFRTKGWLYALFAAHLSIAGLLNSEWRRISVAEETVITIPKVADTMIRSAHSAYRDRESRSPELVRAVSGASSDRASRVARASFILDAYSHG